MVAAIVLLLYFREDGKLRMQFFHHFVEDRTESSHSYHEFLQQLQQQVKRWDCSTCLVSSGAVCWIPHTLLCIVWSIYREINRSLKVLWCRQAWWFTLWLEIEVLGIYKSLTRACDSWGFWNLYLTKWSWCHCVYMSYTPFPSSWSSTIIKLLIISRFLKRSCT